LTAIDSRDEQEMGGGKISGARQGGATRRVTIALWVLCCLAPLAGCDTIPTAGPSISEVMAEARAANHHGFALVAVDGRVLAALAKAPHPSLRQLFPHDDPVAQRIGPGDVLSVAIYDSGVGELFAPPSAQQATYGTARVTLPNATVNRAGMIAVPFAGAIRVAGLTPMEADTAIERRLGGSAVKPQILVSMVADKSNVVTVTGAIHTPGRYAISPASETLLQMIALAGGPTVPASDVMIELTRHGRRASLRLSALSRDPAENLHAMPGDYLNLSLAPPSVLIYGAVPKPGALPLDHGALTLAEALSRAGGPRDWQADSRGVLLFRYEYPEVLAAIPTGYLLAPPPPAPAGQMVPVIYKIDLKTASGIFAATRFVLRDRDLIFVPTAPMVDWEKFLDLFRLTTSPVTTGVAQGIEINRGF
jgi:polysaccharide biosynthesis/export protein